MAFLGCLLRLSVDYASVAGTYTHLNNYICSKWFTLAKCLPRAWCGLIDFLGPVGLWCASGDPGVLLYPPFMTIVFTWFLFQELGVPHDWIEVGLPYTKWPQHSDWEAEYPQWPRSKGGRLPWIQHDTGIIRHEFQAIPKVEYAADVRLLPWNLKPRVPD